MYTFYMTIIPAIDLLGGKCVRLYRGNYDQSTEYKHDPVELAKQFVREGARRIHLVDLDAARRGSSGNQREGSHNAPTSGPTGGPNNPTTTITTTATPTHDTEEGFNNRKIIAAIRAAVPDVTIEVGGGIRTTQDVEELKKIGIDRLIVGTVLVKQPELVEQWAARYPDTFIAGIDAKDGEVRIAGWEEGSALTDTEAARLARESGAVSIIYTNIQRDGTLQGPDVENSLMVADASGLPVIISGGIRGPEDFEEMRHISIDRIAGVITGKAIYENKIKLAEVIAAYQSPTERLDQDFSAAW
jgi:phosphoribosylformimino-5-aminoimidazole carboxamide ribotide isomerase